MERLQKSMTAYVKSLSKRNEGADKEKILPVAYLGSNMIQHGDDFEPDSEYGACLNSMYTLIEHIVLQSSNSSHIGMGRANEQIARTQETYVANSTSSWL